MQKSKRHHLVPRLYLKYFSINGKQTYAYIKNLDECKLVSIKDVAVKENFYTVDHKNIEPHYIESYLSSHIEPLLKKGIEGIIQYVNDKTESLNLHDICRSIICQYYRGSDFRDEANAIANIRANIFMTLFSSGTIASDFPQNANHSLEHAYETFLNETLIKEKINQILDFSEWSIMTSNQCHFITSDRPVLSFFLNHHNKQTYYTKTDIGTPSSYILMAITPSILLQISIGDKLHAERDNTAHKPAIVSVDADYVQSVNYLQQLNYNEHLYGKYEFYPIIDDYTIDSES